jgi:hypothetical protein
MLKLTSFALGLLTLVSIVPSAQAAPIFIGDNRNSQPEVKVIINPQTKTQERYEERRNTTYGNNNSYQSYHERQEAQRRRELEARREAYRRHHHGYNNYHRDSYERYDNKSGYYNNRDRY